MLRRDEDPTRDRITGADWSTPELSSLLAATDTLRLDNRGARPARLVHLRSGRPEGAHRPALLVGQGPDSVLRLLYDKALRPGDLVAVDLQPGNDLGAHWDACQVLVCRPGSRTGDAARHIHLLELRPQAPRSSYTG